jgi:hypothetical protein
MGGACASHAEMRNVYILVREHAGKRPLGRPRGIYENDTRMDLKEIGCEGVDWIHLRHRDQ